MKFKASKFLTLFFLFSLPAFCPQIQAQAQNVCDFPVFPSGREFYSSNFFYSPSAVAVGDVNNDSKPDIVTANYDSSRAETGRIIVFLGNGTGDFSSVKDFNADPFPTDILLGDVNGDGKLDAIVFSYVKDEIRILLGDGAGNFSLLTKYPFYSPRKLEIYDVNRDGRVDLMASGGDSYYGKVSVFPGMGNGTFGNPIDTIITNSNPTSFAIEDFNRDGKIDFATIWSSKVSIWLGDGTGHFAVGWTSNQAYGEILKGNLNNDDYPDLVIGSDAYVQPFFGNGDGSFRVGARYSLDTSGAGTETRITDLNRDGLGDIINSSFGAEQLSIFLGTGNGQFVPLKHHPIGYRPKHIEVGDFNGDSYPDAVTISGNPVSIGLDSIRLTLGKGDGTFYAPTSIGVNLYSNAIAAADVNSDGKDDIVSANTLSQGISVNLRTGDFKFAPARIFAPGIAYFAFVSVADFNNDGKLDIAGVGEAAGVVLLGDGSGNFTVSQQLTTGSQGAWAVFVGSADFNGDGKLDLVVSDRDHYRILIFPGNGDGTFAPPPNLTTEPADLYPFGRISIGDFNRDGKPDLAVVVKAFIALSGEVQILINKGDGTFLTATHYSVGFAITPRSVITNDFDGDGNLDFAVTTDRDPTAPGRVSVYKGKGDGTFSFSKSYSVGDTLPSDLIARDFNNDGKLDIATVNYLLSNDVSILAGNGDGTFSPVQRLPIGKNPQMIVAGNFNNDNSPDLLVNSAGFTIAPNACNQAAETIKPATMFDFDGDGRADSSVFRNGVWRINRSQQGFKAVNWGLAADALAPADYDGDRKMDAAVFRDGVWYWINSSNDQFKAVQFGKIGDIPVPSDFDGDGKADIAVFRPTTGTWYRLYSSNNQFVSSHFGINGDKPLVGDFDGDGRADLAVTRIANGNLFWYWQGSTTNELGALQFGLAEDIATPADFDGDGKTDLAVFRSSNGTWYRLNSAQNNQFAATRFGQVGDVPVAADYDGDGRADISVFRQGIWYRLNSSTNSYYGEQFGIAADKAVPAAFVR